MQLAQIYAAYDWREQREVEKFKFCPACGTQLIQEKVASKTRPLCHNCGFVYYRNPSPTVSVLVIHNRKVLLGKRVEEPGRGKWALPSGYIEFEEDFLTTAIREVKEETGLDIELVSILNVQSAFLRPEYHFLGIYLLAQVTGGNLKPADDLTDVNWFSLFKPLPKMAFPPDVDLIQAYSSRDVEQITIKRNP